MKTPYSPIGSTVGTLYHAFYFTFSGGRNPQVVKTDRKILEIAQECYRQKLNCFPKTRHRAILWGGPACYWLQFASWLYNCWGILAVAAMLLPTVRSRCVELRRNSDSDVPDEASGRLAGEFLAAADTGSRAEVLKWCVGHEGLEPAAARDFVSAVLAEVDERLCFRAPAGNFDRRQLMRLWELFTKCRDYLGANTGVRHVFGLLAVDAVPDGKDNQ